MILGSHFMDWHRIDQGFDAREDGDAGEAAGGNIEATGAVARQAIPVGKPAERPLYHPPPGDDDKALGRRVAFDEAVAHTVQSLPRRKPGFDHSRQRSAVNAPS